MAESIIDWQFVLSMTATIAALGAAGIAIWQGSLSRKAYIDAKKGAEALYTFELFKHAYEKQENKMIIDRLTSNQPILSGTRPIERRNLESYLNILEHCAWSIENKAIDRSNGEHMYGWLFKITSKSDEIANFLASKKIENEEEYWPYVAARIEEFRNSHGSK